MELKITKNEKNEVLGRAEIIAEVTQNTVPSRDEVTKNLAAQLSTSEDKIIVAKVENVFGKNMIMVEAKAYDDVDKMKEVEKAYMLKRNEAKEAPATEETAEAVNEAETETNEVAEQATAAEKTEEETTPKAVEEAKEEAPKAEPATDAEEKKE